MTGISQYTDFAAKNALFVDKTALLQKLVDEKFVLLSRPRRFGKSLLVSMLTELFTNGVKNFQGKTIYERWHEKTYPALNLSFAGLTNPDTHIWHQENRFSRNGHYKPILTRHGGVLPIKA